jgi:hypothetical protein
MAITLRYDGAVFIPEGPVDVQEGSRFQLGDPVPSVAPNPAKPRPLMDLVKALEGLPVNEDWPADGAVQHDHYLYGTPKHPS